MSKSAQMFSYYLFGITDLVLPTIDTTYAHSLQLSGSDNSEILSDRNSGILSVKAARNSGIPKNDVFTFCHTMCNLCTKF